MGQKYSETVTGGDLAISAGDLRISSHESQEFRAWMA
jgi:hypothetical protein